MYAQLASLPLFQGMSKADIVLAMEKIRIQEIEFKKNTVVVDCGQKCRGLYFLVEGEMDMVSLARGKVFRVTERLPKPFVLEPDRLFGLSQHYLHRFVALTKCKCLYVRKDDILFLLNENIVFRLNMLNALSTLIQRAKGLLWQKHGNSVAESIAIFFRQHSRLRFGPKVFHIRMTDLADAVNVSRLEVSIALNEMEREGKIRLQRGIITIPELDDL